MRIRPHKAVEADVTEAFGYLLRSLQSPVICSRGFRCPNAVCDEW